MRIDWEAVGVCMLLCIICAGIGFAIGFKVGYITAPTPTCEVREITFDDYQNLVRRQNAIDMRYDAILEELSFERALQCEEQ